MVLKQNTSKLKQKEHKFAKAYTETLLQGSCSWGHMAAICTPVLIATNSHVPYLPNKFQEIWNGDVMHCRPCGVVAGARHFGGVNGVGRFNV